VSDPTFTVGVSITGECVLSDIESLLKIYPDNTEMLNYPSQVITTDESLRSTVIDLIRAESLTVPPGTEASGPTFTVGVSITGETASGEVAACTRRRSCDSAVVDEN
jgi:hypothetical protein